MPGPFTYPSGGESNTARGGLRTVENIEDRDAIPAEELEEGMLVFVKTENKYFKLVNLDPTWAEFSSGSGGGSDATDVMKRISLGC